MWQMQNFKMFIWPVFKDKTKKYLQARMFKYLFLFLFSSANDSEFDSEDGGDIRFISC